jgi:putative ABC transport system substrate-binding protein
VGRKWLQLLRDLVPTAKTFALLVNPTSQALAEAQSQDLGEAARTLGLRLQLLRASTDSELNSAFATVARLPAGGLVISSDAFYLTRTTKRWRSATRCQRSSDFASSQQPEAL